MTRVKFFRGKRCKIRGPASGSDGFEFREKLSRETMTTGRKRKKQRDENDVGIQKERRREDVTIANMQEKIF